MDNTDYPINISKEHDLLKQNWKYIKLITRKKKMSFAKWISWHLLFWEPSSKFHERHYLQN